MIRASLVLALTAGPGPALAQGAADSPLPALSFRDLGALDAATAGLPVLSTRDLRGEDAPVALRPAAALPEIPPPDLPAATPSLQPPETPPVASPGPPASPPVDAAIRAALGDKGGIVHSRLDRKLRQSIVAAYEARGFQPFWLAGENWTPAARGAIARLRRAAEEGLDPSVYALPPQHPATSPEERLAALAIAEARLSLSVVLYARDARGGRIDARRLSDLIDPTLRLPEPGEVLAAVAGAADAGGVLHGYNPTHEGYRRLRDKLAELRASSGLVAVAIPEGADLKVGMNDPRVPLMRERFGLPRAAEAIYDSELARVVASFQRERGLPATGTFNRRTLSALRDLSGDRMVADIVANMERWRWLPEDLGRRHVVVNIPEFVVRVVADGRKVHEARAIVGKPDTPTPVFSHEMSFMVVNPSWFVPPSILKKEFLPKLASDPSYAERRGYVVVRKGNNISIRQPPGERNALGNIKFMFPNRHAVYLHDTPSRGLFGTERRAYSHGCVRVDNPFRLAELLFDEPQWTERRVRSMVGQGERSLRLERKVPVHLVYFTHFVDDSGRLVIRDDLYGFHRKLRLALGLGA